MGLLLPEGISAASFLPCVRSFTLSATPGRYREPHKRQLIASLGNLFASHYNAGGGLSASESVSPIELYQD
jgi:hypothetical protein